MKKTKEEHLQTVTSILADHLGVDESEITPDKNIYSDLGGDSLDTVELVMALEEEYNIEITAEQGDKFQTVADIVDYLVSIDSEA
jgi:acyl carrier protein